MRVHSHPGGADFLSPEDVEAAIVRGEPLTAVYVPPSEVVRVWRVSAAGAKPLGVAIEGR